MKTLITGGRRFVGSELALHLREQGHRPVAMENLMRAFARYAPEIRASCTGSGASYHD